MSEPEPLLSVEEIAARTDLSPEQVRSLEIARTLLRRHAERVMHAHGCRLEWDAQDVRSAGTLLLYLSPPEGVTRARVAHAVSLSLLVQPRADMVGTEVFVMMRELYVKLREQRDTPARA